MDAGDVLGAELAIAAMPDMDEKPPLQRELRNTLEKLKADRSTLVEQARVEVEEAERAGRLDTGQAQELVERLERLRAEVERCSALDAPTLFSALAQEVKEARGLLDAGRDAVRERIRLRLDALGRAAGEGETAAIERLLDIGQFALAEDLVERLEDGEPFETGRVMPGEAAFDAFFPERAQHLASWLRRTPTAMARLGVGALALPPDLAASSGAKGVELSAVAQPWADCVRNRGNHLRDNLVRLLTELGFTDPELPYFAAPPRNATEAGFQLRVRPLRDRETAVLPQFGSEANGAYRLLCLWGKRDADDVAQALAAATGAAGPTLVLFFAPLDAEQRRRLAALARADRLLSAIVVDEALALHLASLDTARLATLFACTIPFTDARPWAETGTPPPEMFFGRSREVRAVTSMSGEFTHLLYGGRQLGKTAVLRQVEREAADAPDVVVRYISIADIGRTHTPEELWPRLADELAGAGVPIDRQRAGDRGRNFRSAVIAWLDEKPARRILLLLDEADEFFVKDRQNGFPVTELLRTLAVDRDRRFKPVFAGLKNVQKLVRDPNSPLAHLGTPRVVGPLIRGQERNEAAALVTWPFAALGYRMDSAVITRILAFANYYPSLIQVVCQRLLRVLRQQQGGGGPPWTVRMEDVERVLEMPEVRSALFERFRITLELDQRYNLLTLIAADFSLDDPELLARGIDAGTLRSFAADAWPNGFPPEFGGDAFDALLDEMVGLGLFRLVGTGHYALRSGNLAHLIGNRAEIRRQTGEFAARPAPPESDPLESRRTVGERPSLLTARQEHALLGPGGGAVILAGLRLARIDRWRDSIDAACRAAKPKLDVEVRYLTSPYAEAQYERTLATLAGRGGKACLALYVVPPEAPWNAAWVEQAQAQVAAKSLPLRVIFVADAARTWHWLGDPGRPNALCAGGPDRLVAELTAGPWSRTDVDLWIANDRLRGMTTDAALAATGGWGMLVEKLASQSERDRPAADQQARLEDALSDIAEIPAVNRVLRALAEVEALRGENDFVDERMVQDFAPSADAPDVARVLRLGEVLGVVLRGQHGLTLRNELRPAFQQALASAAE